MAIDVEKLSDCAVGVIAIRKALKAADDDLRPEPSVEELKKIAAEAIARDVYGYDAVRNRDGLISSKESGRRAKRALDIFKV